MPKSCSSEEKAHEVRERAEKEVSPEKMRSSRIRMLAASRRK